MKLKTIVLIITSFLLAGTLQANPLIEGEGRFYAKDEDSLSFVKSQLLYSAFVDVITKELKNMGLDNNNFWKSYDEKFDKYFGNVEESLKTKYDLEKANIEKRNKYSKALRLKRLGAKSRYGKLANAIQSYSIKKMSRSPQIPNSRYMQLSARVDHKVLKRIYFKFISKGEAKTFKTLFVTSTFNLIDLGWSDLGVELESDFTQVVKGHWIKWLQENLKTSISETISTDAGSLEEIEEFLKTPQDIGNQLMVDVEENEDLPQPLLKFKDSLWLRVNIDISKVRENLLMKERTFSIAGEFLLIDIESGTLVHSFDVPVEQKKYNFEETGTLSSKVASWIYRVPLNSMEQIDRKLAVAPLNHWAVDLKVDGARSVKDFQEVAAMLSEVGASQRFNARLSSYEGASGVIRLNYVGGRESLISALQKLDNKSILEDRSLLFEDLENPFAIKLAMKGEEVRAEKKEVKEEVKEDKTEESVEEKKETTQE